MTDPSAFTKLVPGFDFPFFSASISRWPRMTESGVRRSCVTTATISLQDARYVDGAKVNRLFDDSLARIRQQPGVEAAGVALGLSWQPYGWWPLLLCLVCGAVGAGAHHLEPGAIEQARQAFAEENVVIRQRDPRSARGHADDYRSLRE